MKKMEEITLKQLEEDTNDWNGYSFFLKRGKDYSNGKSHPIYFHILNCQAEPVFICKKEESEIVDGFDSIITKKYYLIQKKQKLYIIINEITECFEDDKIIHVFKDYKIFDVNIDKTK